MKIKTYAFIDASNIIYGTRDEGWKVDFRKLFKYLKERYSCKKIYYFAGEDEKNRKQQKFYLLLARIGSGDGDFEILLKHFIKLKKEVIVFANSARTAKEIKILRGIQFNDLRSFRSTIEFHQKRR